MRSLLILMIAIASLPAAVREVGPGKTYASLATLPTLNPGDEVRIFPGTYAEVRRWTASGTAAAPITIRGVGATRPRFDASGKDVSGAGSLPRAVFQIEASHVIIDNLEFANARNGNNGAGLRITGGGTGVSGVTVRNCHIHDNDMGVMSDGCDDVLIDGCEIDANGTALFSGYSHNLYLGGTTVTIRGCHIHDAPYGQNVKSRAHFTALLYNHIADSQDGEVGLVDAAATAGSNSNAVLIGNVIISKPRGSGWNSGRFISFGTDGGGGHTGTIYAMHNTCIAGTPSIIFLTSNRPEAGIVARNNVFTGSANLVSAAGAVSGAGNWAPTGAIIPATFSGTLTGSAPGFIQAPSDLHLAVGSPCIDGGAPAFNYVDGGGVSRTAVPTHHHDGVGALSVRSDAGAPDIGAYAAPTGGGTTPPPPVTPPTASATSDGGGGGCGVGTGVASLLLVLLAAVALRQQG